MWRSYAFVTEILYKIYKGIKNQPYPSHYQEGGAYSKERTNVTDDNTKGSGINIYCSIML